MTVSHQIENINKKEFLKIIKSEIFTVKKYSSWSEKFTRGDEQ